MKGIKSSTLLLIFCLFSWSVIAQDFEGIITMNSSGEANAELTFSVKDNKVLVETGSDQGEVKMISERESGNATVLMERNGKKYALRMTPEMLNASSGMIAQPNVDQPGKINVTKESRKIGKYNAYKVTGSDEETEAIAWITKDLGFSLFDLIPIAKQAVQQSGLGSLQDQMQEEGFVLEYWQKDKASGKETEVKVDVKEQEVSSELFNYAAKDYQEFDLTNILKMMEEAQSDPEKMRQLQELMKEFQGN